MFPLFGLGSVRAKGSAGRVCHELAASAFVIAYPNDGCMCKKEGGVLLTPLLHTAMPMPGLATLVRTSIMKPDWLDHVNTYNLKLKLAFAIISISGVHALKTYLSGDLNLESIQIVTMVAVIHFTFVLSAIGISFAERLTRGTTH